MKEELTLKQGLNPGKDPYDQLQLIANFTQIDSNIKKEITPDFTKAKLTDKEKDMIIELTSSGYFCKKIIENLRDLSKYYDWKEKEWKLYTEKNRPKEYSLLTTRAEYVYLMVMNRPYMTAILNRNVKDNYILNLQAGAGNEIKEEETEEKEEAKGFQEKLMKLLKPQTGNNGDKI